MIDRLKRLRKELGFSQAAFAKRIGVSPAAISEIESGRNKLTVRNFDAICREFNVNPTWLETGEGEIFSEPKDGLARLAEEYNLNDGDLAIIKSFAELPPELRVLAVEFAKNFVRNMQAKLDIEDRKPDDQLTVEEKRRIMNEELDAEEKGRMLSAFTGTNGIKKSRRLSR